MPQVIESPPVSIVAAPFPCRRGNVLRIHGWLRVPPSDPRESGWYDGVRRIGRGKLGPTSARVGRVARIRMYRAAPRDEEVTVTFALCGMGEAWLDDVTMTVLQQIAPAATRPAEPTWGDRRPSDSVPWCELKPRIRLRGWGWSGRAWQSLWR